MPKPEAVAVRLVRQSPPETAHERALRLKAEATAAGDSLAQDCAAMAEDLIRSIEMLSGLEVHPGVRDELVRLSADITKRLDTIAAIRARS